MTANIVTAERVRELLDYNPSSGIFTRRVSRKRWKSGSAPGCLDRQGYHRIWIDGIRYNSHRLAWLYVHGRWPTDQLDHINGRRDDNRLSNLREATHAHNQQNQRKAQKNNQSGFLGVRFQSNRWHAYIKVSNKQTYLGSFPAAELAHEAYVTAKRKLHPACTI